MFDLAPLSTYESKINEGRYIGLIDREYSYYVEENGPPAGCMSWGNIFHKSKRYYYLSWISDIRNNIEAFSFWSTYRHANCGEYRNLVCLKGSIELRSRTCPVRSIIRPIPVEIQHPHLDLHCNVGWDAVHWVGNSICKFPVAKPVKTLI